MIKNYLLAGYPGLYVVTPDIYRAQRKIPKEAKGWKVLLWDCCHGFIDDKQNVVEEIIDPVEAVNFMPRLRDTVCVFTNFHLFIQRENPDPLLVQSIESSIRICKSLGSCLLILSSRYKLCPELESLFTLIDYPLPGSKELFELQKEIAPKNVKPNKKAAYSGALGLSEFEAENSYALSLVRKGYFSTKEVSDQKKQILKKSGLLELEDPIGFNQIGGLKNLKTYIVNRTRALAENNPHLPQPRGILLVGIPGTGKSLCCKAVASLLKWQLVRLDIGALKGSLVGQSEKNMRYATGIIDKMQNLVVWLDEVEKQFSGNESGTSDGGTTSGMFSHFLNWMQESKGRKFIVATANNISQLPPEFLRAGRFDATFFVDLPGLEERRHILKIMNKRHGTSIPSGFSDNLSGYSGAEIEQLVKDSLFDGLESAMDNIVPLSKTMKEEIDALRKWAKTRARSANSKSDTADYPRRIIAEMRKGGEHEPYQ